MIFESTSRYDDLSRVSYRTRWKTPRGVIDRNNPPIAGIDGVAAADGITTQTLYDNDVGSGGIGLNSAAGISIDLCKRSWAPLLTHIVNC